MFSANLLHLERDTTVGTFRARFLEQRRHGDREAVRPGAAGVLASNPVQPALSSASEREVGGVDGENAAFHQDAVVKPLREGDAHAADVAGAILELAVAVDPGEGGLDRVTRADVGLRSEEHTSELQSLMRISYAVFCLKKKKTPKS